MSKQTVFKKVMVSDRLPSDYKRYDTNIGNVHFLAFFKSINKIQWWLEEIELPSEEEVTEAYINHKGNINNPALFGTNYILNKLK